MRAVFPAATPGARRRAAWRLGLLAVLILAALSPLRAAAQGIATSPPPVRSSVDGNGVDLVTGALTIATPQVSIGSGEGALTYTRNLLATGWVDNMIGTINVDGSAITVSFGGGSDSFTLSGGVYANALGGGSTLTYSSGAQKYTYTTAQGVVVVFDATIPAYSPSYANGGRPITATWPDGLVVTYTYSTVTVSGTSAARLQSVNNNFGYQLKFTYANNSPGSSSDLVAWTTIASVTGVNNAIEYCSPSANSCTFVNSWPTVTYAAVAGPPSTVTITDPMTNSSVFTYNSLGELLGIQRPGASAFTTTVYYNSSGQVTSVSNGARRIGPKGAGAGVWTYAYATSGSTGTTTVTDPLGHTRVVVSNLTTDEVTSDTDGLDRTTRYQYDSFGRLTRVTYPELNYVVLGYDARGNVTTTTTYPSSGSGSIASQAGFDATCAQPSKCNEPNTTTDPKGNVTNYSYSTGTGQLTRVVGPAVTTPGGASVNPETDLGYSTLSAYYIQSAGGGVTIAPGPVSLLTGTSTCQTQTPAACAGTSDQVTSTLGYGAPNVANNLGVTSVVTAAGDNSLSATASQAYDDYGNVAQTFGPLSTTQYTAYVYDLDRHVLGVVGPEPAGQTAYPATAFVYSPNGQVTTTSYGTATAQTSAALAGMTVAEQSAMTYDALGRPSQGSYAVVSSGGSTTRSLTQWAYDNAGNLLCAAVRMNASALASPPSSACALTPFPSPPTNFVSDRITAYGYDAANEPTSVTLGDLTPQQATYATMTYTPNGFLQTSADADGNLTTYLYDGYDRVSKIEYPSPTTPGASNPGDTEQFTYDANSNVHVDTRRDGATITYEVDALNRVTEKAFSSGTPYNLKYVYDLLGHPTCAWFSHVGAVGLGYAWNALGQTVSETTYQVPSGGGCAAASAVRQIAYAHDAAGDLTGITWPDAGADALTATYAYDILQRVTGITVNGSAIAGYGYDALGRRTSIVRAGGSGAATSVGYAWGGLADSLTQSLSGSGAVTFTLGYDPSGALVSKQSSDSAYLWHPGTASTAYVANGLNQYATVGGSAMAYDARQNLNSDGVTGSSLAYDSLNELLTASAPSSLTLTYDPAGRISTKTGTSSETFLYAGAMLIGEYDSSGNILAHYVPGPGADEAALWYSGSGTSSPNWLHADTQGSTIAWSNATGAAEGTQAYDPFGLPQSWTGGPRYGFTGQLMLSEAQLYDYKARAYDPALGRFLQTDPAGYASDVNPYAYVGNDPVDGSDPSGMVYSADSEVIAPGIPI